MKAVRVHETGGPEKLIYEEVPAPSPGAGQVRVKIRAIGLNYIDVYHRTGLYKVALPFIPGMEAAGTVDAVGANVRSLEENDRVAYAGPMGAYAEYAFVDESRAVKMPDGIDFQAAAAAMLQGMTAHYLVYSTYQLRSGETALIHAAAGGVGLLLIQMAKMIGAKVIGTVSTDAKAALARGAGADHIILYTQDDFEAEVQKITKGKGVDVVYDSVGKTTFDKSLNCLRPRGMLVLFGQSSGMVPPFDPSILNQKGSLYLTRTTLAHYTSTRNDLLWRAGDLFTWISGGKLKIRIDSTFPLRDASRAHQALESRKTSGKVILLP